MIKSVKNVVIIGGNKEALSLLPVLVQDRSARVSMIADPNPHAMLFKLREMGYRLAPKLNIKLTTDLAELKRLPKIDIIINALNLTSIDKFLEAREFRGVEKLSPLSAKLLWQVRSSAGAAVASKGAGGTYNELLSSFREMIDVIRLTSDRNELLSDILNLAIESTRAERGSIMLFSREDMALRMEVAKGMDEEVVRKIRVPLGEGISGKVAKTGKPLMITGKASEEEFSSLYERRDANSALCVPLVSTSGVIGVINVNSAGSYAFSDEDLHFLSTLAGLAAEVIDRSCEYERLRLDSAKFALWKELETSMSDAKPMGQRLNAVCKKVSDLMPGLTCFIYLYDEERKRLSLGGASTRDSGSFGLFTLSAGEALEGCLIDDKRDVILVDRIAGGTLKRAHVVLPMMVKEELVGVFTGQIVSKQGLTKYNESFLRDMASLIAESVYNRRKTEEELSRSKRFFDVDEAGLELLSMKDDGKLLDMIAERCRTTLGAEGCVVRLDDKGAGDYPIAASAGLEKKVVAEHFRHIEDDTFSEVLRRREGVMRELSEEASPYIRGVISVPLRQGGTVRGGISLFNRLSHEGRMPSSFTESDTKVLSRFVVYVEKIMPQLLKKVSPMVRFAVGTPRLFVQRVEDELVKAAKGSGERPALLAIRTYAIKGLAGDERKEYLRKFLTVIQEKTKSFDTVVMLDEDTLGVLYVDADSGFGETLNEAFLSHEISALDSGAAFGLACYPEAGASFEKLLSHALIGLEGGIKRVRQH